MPTLPTGQGELPLLPLHLRGNPGRQYEDHGQGKRGWEWLAQGHTIRKGRVREHL